MLISCLICLIEDVFHSHTLPMRSLWNPATGRHLLLAARRHSRQVVGSDVNADSDEHGEQPAPESPVMMCAPPVRSLTMDMMTLAVRMQMFGIAHGHVGL
jgi:hypothetical protein